MNQPRFITTPAGVSIGCAYQRPAPHLDRDHQQVQAALLDSRTTTRPTLIQRVAAPIWRWL